MILNLN